MRKIRRPHLVPALAGSFCLVLGLVQAAPAEWNPVQTHPVEIGPQADRLIVGFKVTSDNAVIKMIPRHSRGEAFRFTQAQTSAGDVLSLIQRTGIAAAGSRQITPSMHVIFLPKTLYGVDVTAALEQLRADPSVQFAAADQHRYPHLAPTNPLYKPTTGVASGQWYMKTPGPTTVEGVSTTDFAATDAESAWNITTGSPGIVIADVDTGVRFDHPDLLRAGLGGRLLPGYDFVGQDFNPNSPFNALSTHNIANDLDGWDPDPSDPGDWISSTDVANVLFAKDTVANSSWHGTRVVGVFGAITNNAVGTAGMTWGTASQPGPWVLPVRALGKGGGYDSDIIAGIEWAAGLAVTNPDGSAVPDNPYPADIINLSLGGGTDACSSSNGSAYQKVLTNVTGMGVLVVVSAGNGGSPGSTAPVELPANCSAVVPGVLAVAGLRNVGTKVGYSSFGAEVSIAAPAGNCIVNAPPCLRSIDTTTNSGATVPAANSYTDEANPNLGTSFSAPIVSGIAALMRSVNNNLTPAQLASRIKLSSTAFPAGAAGVPTCPTNDPVSGECVCPNDGSQCGAGMVNAYKAVQAAQKPIGVIVIPNTVVAGSVFDASRSVAGCDASKAPPVPLSIASYQWTASPISIIVNGASTPQVKINPAPGTLTLTVTDSAGNFDVETVTLTANSATTTAPSSAGSSASACPTPVTVTPEAPVVTEAFSPGSVAPSVTATLTITLTNSNGFALTQTGLTQTLPANLTIATMPAPATTCGGASKSLSNTTSSVTLAAANIPANGSCTITMSVMSTMAGTYTNTIAASALSTGPAGSNTASTSASLDVAAPASKSGGGGLGWLDIILATGALLAGRRFGGRAHRAN